MKAGGKGRLAWHSGASYDLKIEAVDPLRRFAFRWVYPRGATPDSRNSLHVEFTLRSEGGSTRLRVVESGFDKIDWAEADRPGHVEEHTRGWEECFERLQRVAVRQARTRPQA